ncbi:hypothetical protein C6Y45_01085 [Alkalicoccus saliphilus]|uniref:Uncharacterized protein n=1 Tax=Alkalicoccus saliphilus TaxID=200989 RepID=A0A2T4UAW0_9BACI|nr:hypothetical protein C6Y45_01085 [Alkalicoccus saliphilus]
MGLAVSCLPCGRVGSSDFALSHRRPRRTFRRKKHLLYERKDGINTFLEEKPSFYFPAGAAAGDSEAR